MVSFWALDFDFLADLDSSDLSEAQVELVVVEDGLVSRLGFLAGALTFVDFLIADFDLLDSFLRAIFALCVSLEGLSIFLDLDKTATLPVLRVTFDTVLSATSQFEESGLTGSDGMTVSLV